MTGKSVFSTSARVSAAALALSIVALWPAAVRAGESNDATTAAAAPGGPASTSSAAPPQAAGQGSAPATSASSPAPLAMATVDAPLGPKAAALFKDVSKLVKEYYPNAKPVIKDCHYHLEYKARSYDVPQTNSFDMGPDWGGLVLDMQLKPGPYDGVKSVPCQFNEFSYYVVLLFAPYSKPNNCHLLARISHPFDVPPDFLARLKQLVNGFDQHF